MIEIYTDGSCLGNGKEINYGGFSNVLVKDGQVVKTSSIGCPNTTNNEMELKAVYQAIVTAKMINSNPARKQEIKILTDSEYVFKTVMLWMHSWQANNWVKKSDKKPPENLELIKKIFALMQYERAIKIEKVKGHDGNEFNELADQLAVAASNKTKKEMEQASE